MLERQYCLTQHYYFFLGLDPIYFVNIHQYTVQNIATDRELQL